MVLLRTLQENIAALDGLGEVTGQLWAGLKTRLVDLRAARAFQTVLACAHNNAQWEDQGFESIDDGRCGGPMSKDLKQVRDLARLNQEIIALDALTPASQCLWQGHDTNINAASTGLAFQDALAQAKARHPWSKTNLHAVADGSCGAAMLTDLNSMNHLLELEHQIASHDELRTLTHGVWDGLKSQLDEIDQAAKFHASLAPTLSNLASIPDEVVAIKAILERLLGDGNTLLAPSGPVPVAGDAYIKAHQALQQSTDQLSQLAGASQETPSTFRELMPSALVVACQEMVAAEPRLRAWCAWRKARDEALLLGLGAVAEAIEHGTVALGSVREAFETNYCRWWLNTVVDSDNVLRNFVSAEHEKRIKDFQVLDDRFTELTQAWVRARLCAELPD